MNIVNKLTLRHIKTHKRRLLLTVLSIIVSVAMVTAVFTSVFSFLKFLNASSLAYDGSWQAQLFYDETPDFSTFESENMDYYAGYNAFQFTYDKNVESAKAYAQVDAVDEAAVGMRNIKILEGTFPKNKSDILITKEYMEKNKLSWKTGDTVSLWCLDFDTQKEGYKDYTICGIAEGNVSFFDHRDAIVARTEGKVSYVILAYKTLDKTFYKNTEALQKKTNASEHISYNTDLLDYSGIIKDGTSSTMRTIKIFTAIILAVIVVASVFMIYDSFAVSYQERERYLGMLASVGATKRQKRSSIYFEGFILGAIGIPLGIIAGFIGMGITFKSIEEAFLTTVAIPIKGTLKVHFSPYIMLGTVLISTLTIFISCYIPARRASKTTPIAAIKGTNTVKVKKAKRLRVSRLTRKLYGFEGELAVKNFKRNGRRSRNIVFALVMSVVLFLSVTNFSQMFTSVVRAEAGEDTPDFILLCELESREKAEKYFDGADVESYLGYIASEAILDNTELFTEDTKRAFSLNADTEKDVTDLYVFVMDNASFDGYLKSIDESTDGYHDAKNPKAVIFNRVTDQTGSKPKNYQAFTDDALGKVLNCHVLEYNEDTSDYDIIRPFSVTAGTLTDKEYDSTFFPPKYFAAPSLILSEDTVAALPLERRMFNIGVFAKDYKAAIQAADAYFEGANVGYEIIDSTSQMKMINALLKIMKVFIYGFITLLTLIAVINIINSIANSMNERKTEFAMLKSVGVTPKGFRKMIYVESVRYGVKSLIWSLPISALLHYLMYYALSKSEGMVLEVSFNLPYYIAAVLAVFVIILVSLLYSADKIKDDNIIENLKQD